MQWLATLLNVLYVQGSKLGTEASFIGRNCPGLPLLAPMIILVWYLKIDHGPFIPCPFRITIHNRPVTLHYVQLQAKISAK